MISVKQILTGKYISKELILNAWVKTHQIHGNISFIQVNDGSTFKNLQIIYKKPLDNIATGSAVEIKGIITESKGEQKYELNASEINILATSENFPIQKKEHSLEFLRENSHLRHRTSLFTAINTIKNELFQSTHHFLKQNHFYWIQSPIITNNNCEGGACAFKIEESEKFFKKQALLSVSGQFHAEALAQGLSRVYTFGPTFRAEKSNSSTHLAEFWMIEPEIAFCDLEKLMDFIENYIKYVINSVLNNNKEELELLSNKLPNNENLINKLKNLVTEQFHKIEYEQAIDLLKHNGYDVKMGSDLNSEQEKYITNVFKKPVFVFNYPKQIKAFYMKDLNKMVVNSVDLLVPEVGELIGGSVRENSLDLLRIKAKELDISLEGLAWYENLRKYGYYSSAGFGCGYERLVLYATGLKNIRDAITFPRSYNQLEY